ncbi:hypothetical protein EDB69_0689 [Vibrio crassostreae]|uniref:GIY-YIG nuclease family protein n=1 Tax=Vibrio crassostreae TaxID=246167 RepID=UPI000F4A3614|nr:GIY-YIG nuclease family protein [Vibrio crassostreae]ROO76023.1 hypothetical protein EDB64_1007 [Vibrio crassostreae]ROP14030.1 hypothetical protein EDB63_1035 [Vibrio crassostreae]ROQ88118.1 hypothetical protein EDB72_1674 [Vibrio crassostreae]RPE94733.1 hypothetical protein EDB68_0766 [Vibrio crassostreae]RPF06199.1 hypothetical protein EDB17_0660 [Vibrio crassostreae]
MPKPQGFWNIETLSESASKYSTKKEWRESEGGAYATWHKLGAPVSVVEHMSGKKTNNYWTEQRIISSAKKHTNKSDWLKNERGAYKAWCRLGHPHKFVSHMYRLPNIGAYRRDQIGYIYVLLDDKGNTKVGISNVPWNRVEQLKLDTPNIFSLVGLFSHADGNLAPRLEKKVHSKFDRAFDINEFSGSTEWLKNDHAAVLSYINTLVERYKFTDHSENLIEDFEVQVSRNEYNRSGRYWTLDRVNECARNFLVKGEWIQSEPSAYSAWCRFGQPKETIEHMEYVKKPNGYWTAEKLKISAIQYKTRTEWKAGDSAAYSVWVSSGSPVEVVSHMISTRKEDGYWTLEKITESALKYHTRSSWRDAHKSAYGAWLKLGKPQSVVSHMQTLSKPKGYWTLERIIESASKFGSKMEWKSSDGGGYTAWVRSDKPQEAVKHMK